MTELQTEAVEPAHHISQDPAELTHAPQAYTERLAKHAALKYEAIHAGSAAAVEKQDAKGRYTTRERIEKLLDPGSFQELDVLMRHRTTEFRLHADRPNGDAIVTGHSTIDGRRSCVLSQDFTVFGGSLGEVMAEKICKVMDLAEKIGCPVIDINDSGGARIQEGMVALCGYGDVFYRYVRASGVIPQISLMIGPCAGGAVYRPAITDFVFVVRETSHMFITGPDVIRTVSGRRLHRRACDQARCGLHRRLHRIPGQADGSRRRDRLRLPRHRSGQGRGARGQGRAGRPHPTQVAEIVMTMVGAQIG